MWERWREGESLHAIAQLFDRHHGSVRGILARAGGIRPQPRTRSARALALAEREEISRGVMAGQSVRSIARLLRRAPSTVSREIHRNGGPCSYRASVADQAAWDRALRPKPCKLAQNRALARAVAEKLRLQWSPYQVAGWLKRTYPQDETRQVSHETIYRRLFIQARGALKKELLQHLRRTRGMRRSRHHTQKTANHGQIIETVSIRERPAEAEDRAVPGHWEGDLFFGSRNSQIATLVERQTRYVMLVKVAGQGHRDGRQRADQAGAQAAAGALQVADLGSRQGDGGPPALLAGDRHPGLLLRSAAAVAARLEREHQRSAAPVLPKGMDLSDISQQQAQCRRSAVERTAAADARLRDAGRTFSQCVASIG